jgi:hypothetical protein
MTEVERLRFVDNELKGLWPQWEPTEAEIEVWMGVLARPTYAVARTAVQQCFRERAGHYRRPMPAPFVTRLKLLAPHAGSRTQPASDIETNTFIECLDPPVSDPHLAGVRRPVCVLPTSRQSDPDHVHACAESMRQRFEHLYGGHWITIRTEPSATVDDGLRDPAALDKARANILAGPDTPGNRWLQRHLARNLDPMKSTSFPTV